MISVGVVLFGCFLLVPTIYGQATGVSSRNQSNLATPSGDEDSETKFLTDVFQLTYEGKRSGEGYFSADGKRLVYQSEQEPGNPFYQIYLFDFDQLESRRVSPGHGKTTCAWIHPDGTKVLFASTQNDPDAVKKQKEEIALRESGQQRRYAWDYDATYDLIEYDVANDSYRSLTTEKGYDAEGSYSPDGSLIAFASNRHAYGQEMTPEQQRAFEIDPAVMMDIFIMNADGSNVRQLTNTLGYDGGPFFSADGKKICWRRFAENGATAEIFTMNIDGTDEKQLTNMKAMSWAPYFHPTGKYLIFTTNKQGMDNFELYLVDAEGKSQPVRVTTTPGFDGLSSWDPKGERLTWTSNRGSDTLSQIYVGTWNHQAAMEMLRLKEETEVSSSEPTAVAAAQSTAQATSSDFTPADFRKHVEYLCQPSLEGRMTGSAGERKATAYVAAYLDHLGVQPAGDNGSWFQAFDFPAGAKLGPDNSLKYADQSYQLDSDWRPLTFSKTGEFAADVVFAGYGIIAPAEGDIPEYDSYVHLDVQDKWVLLFRYFPENVSDAQRQHFQYHSSLRKKAMDARDKGAKGIIVVSGPNSAAREELVPLEKEFSIAGSSIAALTVTDRVAGEWLAATGRDLQTLQNELDSGKPMMGIALKGVSVSTTISIEQQTGVGRNVVGRFLAGDEPAEQAILIGAHIDHLGSGRSSSSLARGDEATLIHFGADDNASGVAAMLEIAEYLAQQKQAGKLKMQRDVIFAAWSGEELGLQGSQHFVETFAAQIAAPAQDENSADNNAPVQGGTTNTGSTVDKTKINIYPTIAACLNMDMVGRYDGTLILQGIGSSTYWKKAAQKNAATQLNLKLSDDTSLPTDASSFYRAGVPILSAFTGSHQDYHTPRDTPEKLNYEEAARISKLLGLISIGLVTGDDIPEYQEHKQVVETQPRANMRAYVGSIPDYAGDVKGVLLSGVTEGSPAAKAGVQGGDIIVELAGKKVENIYDYTYAIEALKPGTETTIVVLRDEKRVELKLVPGRR